MSERPLLVYDGDCGFCRRWVARWRGWTGDRVEYVPYQDLGGRHPEIRRQDFDTAVHLRDGTGRWTRGAAAALGALQGVPVLGVVAWGFRRIPPLAAASEAFYRWVARNRGRW